MVQIDGISRRRSKMHQHEARDRCGSCEKVTWYLYYIIRFGVRCFAVTVLSATAKIIFYTITLILILLGVWESMWFDKSNIGSFRNLALAVHLKLMPPPVRHTFYLSLLSSRFSWQLAFCLAISVPTGKEVSFPVHHTFLAKRTRTSTVSYSFIFPCTVPLCSPSPRIVVVR